MQSKEKINRPSQGFEALPYLQGLTEEIEENICKTQCLGPSYTICNASIDSIRPKDPLDPSEKYAVVYKVASKQWPSICSRNGMIVKEKGWTGP